MLLEVMCRSKEEANHKQHGVPKASECHPDHIAHGEQPRGMDSFARYPRGAYLRANLWLRLLRTVASKPAWVGGVPMTVPLSLLGIWAAS